MYPFGDRELPWFLRDRYGHLLAALDLEPPVLPEPEATSMRRRRAALRVWTKVRTFVLVLLSAGVITAIVSGIVQRLPSVAEVEATRALVERIARYAGASSGALTVVALVLTRLLAQIEMDILLLLRKEGKEQPRKINAIDG